MRIKRVYLAGHLNNSWEKKAKIALETNEVSTYYARDLSDCYFDYLNNDEQQKLKFDTVKQNLNYLRYCDIILFNLNEIAKCFELVTELAYAYKENKIIIGFGGKHNYASLLLCTHIATDLEEALEYVKMYGD